MPPRHRIPEPLKIVSNANSDISNRTKPELKAIPEHLSSIMNENELTALLGRSIEILSCGTAQFQVNTGLEWRDNGEGVVCVVKNFDRDMVSVFTIDTAVENARTISTFNIESIERISKISPHLITFSKTGLSFKSTREADNFYRILIEEKKLSDRKEYEKWKHAATNEFII